jgi:hypothetical protein
MGCACTNNCGKSTEELSEFNPNYSKNPNQLNEIIVNNPKLLSSLIKIQSNYRGMKIRETIKPKLNKINDVSQNKINYQPNQTSQSNIIIDDELNLLLKIYPPLNDNIQVEITSPIEYPTNRSIYFGEWDSKNKVRHGRGILIWPEGSKYSGYWVGDKANIKGKLIHSDGDIYEGEWSDDKPNGKGIYYHKDGTIYEGDWKNDKQDGNGKEKWVDGAWYEGEYKDGKKHGKGKFHWSDNSYYEGNFVENNISGKGIYIFSDKRKYEGNWENNRLHGYGIFTWPDGRKYEGDYQYDKKEGYGIFTWNDGKQYKGFWKDGKQNGEGEFFFPSENIWKKGIWENGKRIKWIE